jgi:Na+-transporting methylmalonyl-CoA/oxaloacetate decarboxylase gamma subunit
MITQVPAILLQAAPTTFEEGDLHQGLIIAIVGLLIVFLVLIFLSLFIASLPKVLALVGRVWPEVEEHRAISNEADDEDTEMELLAAIGFVLHTEFQRQASGGQSAK